MAMTDNEKEFYGRLLASSNSDKIGYDKIMELIRLFNLDPNKIPREYKQFVLNDLINRARQCCIDLAFYTDGNRLYIGPKYNSDFDRYGMPTNVKKLDLLALSIAGAYDQVKGMAKRVQSISNPLVKAQKIGFLVVYKEPLENGNVEYILFHPAYKATMHFELTACGDLDPNYNPNAIYFVLMPRKSNTPSFNNLTDNKTCVSYYKFDDDLIEKLEKAIPANWPQIKIGKDHFFTSTQDRTDIYQTDIANNHEQVMNFFSLRTLQKIACSNELTNLMCANNINQLQRVVLEIGLTSQEALEHLKSKTI